MNEKKESRAFIIDAADNTATALGALAPGAVEVIGDKNLRIDVHEKIPIGHKIALCDIPSGADIVKYGVSIGKATKDIAAGSWVHLHCMRSAYDERSSHLDVITGVPTDIDYDA